MFSPPCRSLRSIDAMRGEDLSRMWALGQDLARRGRWHEALPLLLQLRSDRYFGQAATLQACVAYLHLGRAPDAWRLIEWFDPQAVTDPNLVLTSAQLFREFEDSSALIQLHRAGHWRALDRHRIVSLAKLFVMNNLVDVAAGMLFDQVDESSDLGIALHLKGLILQSKGQFDDAMAAYQEILRQEPAHPQAIWSALMLEPGSTKIAALAEQALLIHAGNDTASAYVHYALHHHWSALRQYDDAWHSLECAMSARRRCVAYCREETIERFEAIKRMDQSLPPLACPEPSPVVPIFIVGMHRSGTTLLEHLLEKQSEVHAGGESYVVETCMRIAGIDVPSFELDSVDVKEKKLKVFRAECIKRYASRAGSYTHYIEKLPQNFQYIGLIARAMPEARILNLVRSSTATCWSNLRTLFDRTASYSYSQIDMADYFCAYLGLMRYFRREHAGRVLDVSYARLAEAPEEEATKVLQWCGMSPTLAATPSTTRSVLTASSITVRGAVDPSRDEAWKPYADHLRPLIDRLEILGVDRLIASC